MIIITDLSELLNTIMVATNSFEPDIPFECQDITGAKREEARAYLEEILQSLLDNPLINVADSEDLDLSDDDYIDLFLIDELNNLLPESRFNSFLTASIHHDKFIKLKEVEE